MQYWIPLLYNYKWTGKALPLPLNNNFISKLYWKNNNLYCKYKNKTYTLALNKIFNTSIINKPISLVDLNYTKSLNHKKGIKIILSGRLKGISKAKSMTITSGIIRAQSIDSKLEYYSRPIYTKWGTMGLKVFC